MLESSRFLGKLIGKYLTTPTRSGVVGTPASVTKLQTSLKPGDVLLIEGDFRISTIIKYMTQSTWSHAAIYIGPVLGQAPTGDPYLFIEADLIEGVRKAPLREYTPYHTRICRPYNLESDDCKKLLDFMISQLGRQYDLKNVFDLARYLVPLPIPPRFRRRMMTLGSGDPTKAICSSVIAEGFQYIRYPVLPNVQRNPRIRFKNGKASLSVDELLIPKHPTLIAPRDFDVSPYFEIVKPTIDHQFDYRDLLWAAHPNVSSHFDQFEE